MDMGIRSMKEYPESSSSIFLNIKIKNVKKEESNNIEVLMHFFKTRLKQEYPRIIE